MTVVYKIGKQIKHLTKITKVSFDKDKLIILVNDRAKYKTGKYLERLTIPLKSVINIYAMHKTYEYGLTKEQDILL